MRWKLAYWPESVRRRGDDSKQTHFSCCADGDEFVGVLRDLASARKFASAIGLGKDFRIRERPLGRDGSKCQSDGSKQYGRGAAGDHERIRLLCDYERSRGSVYDDGRGGGIPKISNDQ